MIGEFFTKSHTLAEFLSQSRSDMFRAKDGQFMDKTWWGYMDKSNRGLKEGFSVLFIYGYERPTWSRNFHNIEV